MLRLKKKYSCWSLASKSTGLVGRSFFGSNRSLDQNQCFILQCIMSFPNTFHDSKKKKFCCKFASSYWEPPGSRMRFAENKLGEKSILGCLKGGAYTLFTPLICQCLLTIKHTKKQKKHSIHIVKAKKKVFLLVTGLKINRVGR